MIVKIQINDSKTKMKITSKPSESKIGDINIVLPIDSNVLQQLGIRFKAYFYAISTHGKLKIYTEMKPLKEW